MSIQKRLARKTSTKNSAASAKLAQEIELRVVLKIRDIAEHIEKVMERRASTKEIERALKENDKLTQRVAKSITELLAGIASDSLDEWGVLEDFLPKIQNAVEAQRKADAAAKKPTKKR